MRQQNLHVSVSGQIQVLGSSRMPLLIEQEQWQEQWQQQSQQQWQLLTS
jgi:hypothetical protein